MDCTYTDQGAVLTMLPTIQCWCEQRVCALILIDRVYLIRTGIHQPFAAISMTVLVAYVFSTSTLGVFFKEVLCSLARDISFL